MLEETEVGCPYCGETIPLFLDLSAGSQEYIEDCSVCCQPITVRLQVDEDDPDTGYRVEVTGENE